MLHTEEGVYKLKFEKSGARHLYLHPSGSSASPPTQQTPTQPTQTPTPTPTPSTRQVNSDNGKVSRAEPYSLDQRKAWAEEEEAMMNKTQQKTPQDEIRTVNSTPTAVLKCDGCVDKAETILQLKSQCLSQTLMIYGLDAEKKNLEKLVHESFAMRERVGELNAQIQIYEPAYRREILAINQNNSRNANDIGAKGEEDVRSLLQGMIGGTADLRITNSTKNAGDMQILFPIHGASRPALITIEVKSSKEGKHIIRKGYIDQATEQINSTKSDAGLLLYSHEVSPTERFFVLEQSRLVVCGTYHDHGVLFSALLTALMIAQKHLLAGEASQQATQFSEGEMVMAKDAARMLVSGFGKLRRKFNEISVMVKTIVDEDRKSVIDILNSVSKLASTKTVAASSFFPVNSMQLLQVPRERLGIKRKESDQNFTTPEP